MFNLNFKYAHNSLRLMLGFFIANVFEIQNMWFYQRVQRQVKL